MDEYLASDSQHGTERAQRTVPAVYASVPCSYHAPLHPSGKNDASQNMEWFTV